MNRKISEMATALSLADNDLLTIVQGGVNKQIEADTLKVYTDTSVPNFWDTTALETANSITPTDKTYAPGNVFRYGAVADSGSGSQGTDNAAAFQAAADSGHTIYVPEGWYSIESTVFIIGDGSEDGGKTFIGSSEARCERYTNVATPIFHFAGDQNSIDGRGMILAARNFGGFTRGLLLYGQDPNATDNTGATEVDTMSGFMKGFKVIGNTTTGVTGWDGSVGIYFESAARRRGTFSSPATINSYYGKFSELYSLQWDYPFFLSTDFNGHTFKGCLALSFGHAAFWVNGYANTFLGCWGESPTAQDTTERGGFVWGNKDSGPEAVNKPCEDGATTLSIIAITKGNPTTIQTSTSHGESTGNLIKLDAIVDSGAGDLESALNTNHYKLTSTGADTFTIPVDTSAVSATWSSGGTVNQDPYPILGARSNHVIGASELQFDASTKVTRIFLQDRPGGNYDTEKEFRNVFGKNVMDVSGTFAGGVANNGFSTPDSVLNNIVNYTHGVVDYDRPINYHGFQFRKQNDNSGDSFGTNEFKVFSGRIANVVDSTNYSVITISGVGPTSASVIIKLDFVYKDATNQDHEGGELSWLCPVAASTAQTPIKIKDFQANYNAAAQPYTTWSVVESTVSSKGVFELRVNTGNPAGAGDAFITWRVEFLTSQLEGTGIDWDNDVTIQNGA